MRVLRIYPTANDPRHRQRDLALLSLGVEVGLVAPDAYGVDWSTTPIEAELPHWRSRLLNRNSIPLHLWAPRALRKAVRAFRPTVVDVHDECYFPAAAQAVVAAARRPVVMFAAQNIPKRYPAPFRGLQHFVFRRAAGFYACSGEATDVLRGWGYRGRVDVVPYGVEDELFDVRRDGDRIGFVGRLAPEKGVADILRFGPRLLCVGDGPLAPQVRAAGGEVVATRSVAELAVQLARMAVLVMPSLSRPNWKEQFGRAAVEAMAAGVPVVAYDSGSLREVVGDAGVLVPEGDADALGRMALHVAVAPEELGERGRDRARERFRWTKVAEQMVELYRGALAA
jgi:glycosyltransferase involved in cell wall biosynthesis